MIEYFGIRYNAPIYKDATKIVLPQGMICRYCYENVRSDDDGFKDEEGYIHRECNMCAGLGTISHQQKTCHHFEGSMPEIDVRLTLRQNALMAALYFYTKMSGHGMAYYKHYQEDDESTLFENCNY